eukprot:1383071-Pleurochrysis_carterae.AAC.1
MLGCSGDMMMDTSEAYVCGVRCFSPTIYRPALKYCDTPFLKSRESHRDAAAKSEPFRIRCGDNK